jgi:hypothetical protein
MSTPTIAALIVVVGSMSLVSAAPARDEHSERVRYNEKTHYDKTPKAGDGWVELASSTPASNGREYIVVNATAGTFTMLRIDADKDRPIVQSVRIEYRNGTHRIVQLDKVLDEKKRQSAFVDLHGPHEIESLVVVTDRDSRGSYAVLGMTEKVNVAGR